jgi:hypothetical protein
MYIPIGIEIELGPKGEKCGDKLFIALPKKSLHWMQVRRHTRFLKEQVAYIWTGYVMLVTG